MNTTLDKARTIFHPDTEALCNRSKHRSDPGTPTELYLYITTSSDGLRKVVLRPFASGKPVPGTEQYEIMLVGDWLDDINQRAIALEFDPDGWEIISKPSWA